jgi:tetratricopeptide (TPR) repeat protein
LADLSAALAYRTFVIREKESFIDRDIVNKNITEVSLFFIAMGLTLDGKVWKSREILEGLLSDVRDKVKANPQNMQLKSFYGSIMSCLSITLLSIFRHIYENHLIENITDRSCDNYAENCLEVLNRLVSLDRKPLYDYYVNIAIIYFHFGKIRASREAIEKAKKIAPNNAVPHFSSAFLYLWKDDIKKALKEYSRAKKQLPDVGVALRVLLFLQGLLRVQPEKIQLLFSLAFVNDYFFDKVQAKRDYELFIEKAKGNPVYVPLCDYSSKRILELQREGK